jgi:indoleamine 2,3-dioxygenase
LDSLKAVRSFTGAVDESWFYLVSVAIEAQGAPLILTALEATRCAEEGRKAVLAQHLRRLAAGLEQLSETLKRLYENCDPHHFYHKLRPFLAGGKNMAKSGLPHGILFDDGTGTAPYVQFAGGSNAQSSLFQLFDIALGVTHRATGAAGKHDWRHSAPPPSGEGDSGGGEGDPDYITEMRQYMPAAHRRFLEDFSRVANIRQFVDSNVQHEALVASYNACLAALVAFRNVHLQVVSRYIVLHSQDQKSTKISRTSADLPKSPKGTGGTALMPFLRQVRDETAHTYAQPAARVR